MILCRPVEQTKQNQLYRIEIPEDKNNTVYYCRERLEETIRSYIHGMKKLEIEIVLDELKRKGVIIPS